MTHHLRVLSRVFFAYCLYAVLVGSPTVFAGTSYGVGQRDYSFKDTARDRSLATHVWYPAATKKHEKPKKEKTGGVFLSVTSAMNAASASGSKDGFPVVLLSHGAGGLANKLFWVTEVLVRHGVMVVAVDHPGNMTGDTNIEGFVRMWERAKDLTFALDRLLELPEFAGKMNLAKVGAVGHSAGGTTALLLGGARFSAEQFSNPTPHCVGTKDPYFAKLCSDVQKINFKSYPKEIVEGAYGDKRVRAVVGFDPGYATSFDKTSVKQMPVKVRIFIADKLNTPQDEINSKDFLQMVPEGSAAVVPGSYHMTFLQACKPGFPKNDPELAELCIENDRKLAIQKQVAKETLEFFEHSWKN